MPCDGFRQKRPGLAPGLLALAVLLAARAQTVAGDDGGSPPLLRRLSRLRPAGRRAAARTRIETLAEGWHDALRLGSSAVASAFAIAIAVLVGFAVRVVLAIGRRRPGSHCGRAPAVRRLGGSRLGVMAATLAAAIRSLILRATAALGPPAAVESSVSLEPPEA